MIITEKIDKDQTIFDQILKKSYTIITDESLQNPSFFQNRNPTEFEHDVYEALCEASKKTEFDKSTA